MKSEIDNPIYPIQLVSRRSGLSVDLIRAWEKRYRVVNPQRGENKRRLYSEQDVQHLTLLHRLTALGHRIGDIVRLSENQLNKLLEPVTSQRQVDNQSVLLALHQQGLSAVEALDREKLNQILIEAELQLPLPLLLNDWLGPLMRAIGTAWRLGELRIYQEHMASTVISSWLLSKIRQRQNMTGPILVVTTPTGQQHSIGAMMVTLLANSLGWQAHYLSPQLPAEEIAAAANQLHARAIALSIGHLANLDQLQTELYALQKLKPKSCALLLGGVGIQSQPQLFADINAHMLNDLHQLAPNLEQLGPNQ